MSDPHVISALRSKRAELAGDIAALFNRINLIRIDLDAIDRALRIFDPTIAPEKIRPVIKRKGAKLFRHGECARAIFGLLRDSARPMTPGEIEDSLILDYRLDVRTAEAKTKLRGSIRGSLTRHAGRTLVKSGRGGMAAWSVKV